MLAAETDDLAAHQHDLEPQNIIGGEAIFEAMHAAGVFRDIAADRTGDLRRRIGRVIKALGFHRLGDRQILHAGLHARAAVFIVDFEDAVELRHAQKNAVLERHRAAGQRRAGAARHDLHIHLLRQRHDRLHLRDRFRQRDDQRQRAIHGEGVAVIGAARCFVGDHALRRKNRAQPRQNLVTAREDFRLGRGH